MDGLQPRVDLRPGTGEFPSTLRTKWMQTPGSMSTHCTRSSWRGRNGLPARSLRRYILWSTVVTPVTPVLTPRPPEPFRQYRSPPTPGLGGVVASTSAGQDTRKVELTPLPGLTQQFAIQVEREIQKQIQECSRQIVQDVLQRSANRTMPPTPSEAARASLSQCFQKALATPWTELGATPGTTEGQTRGELAKYSTGRPICWNQPAPT